MGALRATILAAGFAVLVPSALAHHSASAIFDVTKTVTVQGTLTKVDWINPHIALYIESQEGGKTLGWEAAGAPPAWWRNVGVNRATFAAHVGKTVVVEGAPARDGSNLVVLRKVTFPDGEVLQSISIN